MPALPGCLCEDAGEPMPTSQEGGLGHSLTSPSGQPPLLPSPLPCTLQAAVTFLEQQWGSHPNVARIKDGSACANPQPL